MPTAADDRAMAQTKMNDQRRLFEKRVVFAEIVFGNDIGPGEFQLAGRKIVLAQHSSDQL